MTLDIKMLRAVTNSYFLHYVIREYVFRAFMYFQSVGVRN